jgi:hypothetical protein
MQNYNQVQVVSNLNIGIWKLFVVCDLFFGIF